MKGLFLRLFGPYFKLPRGIWALFTAILVNRFGAFVAPFLALYLTQKAGYTAEQAGFVIMLLPIAVIPALLGGGWLCDHWGRRRVLVLSQAFAGLAYVAASFDPLGPLVPFWIFAATFLASVASIGHNAMLNDLAGPEQRKTAYSLNYLGINLGFSLGPMAAGFLFNADLQAFFLIDGLTTLASAAVVLLCTRETLHTITASNGGGEAHESGGVVRALFHRPYFLIFLAISVLSNAVYGQHTFSLPLQLNKDFGVSGATMFGLLMGVNGLTVVAASTVITRLTARFASLPTIAAASVLYAVGFGMIPLVALLPGPAAAWFILSTVIWTLGEILASVGGQVYIASHTPANHRGRFNSVRHVVFNLSSGLTTGLAGMYIGSWGISAVWPVVAAAAVVSASALLAVHRIESRTGSLDDTRRQI